MAGRLTLTSFEDDTLCTIGVTVCVCVCVFHGSVCTHVGLLGGLAKLDLHAAASYNR